MVKFYAYDLNDSSKRVKVSVYKDDDRRCVILSVCPVTIEDRGHGLISESFRLMSGRRAVVEPMIRLNKKRLEAIAEEVRQHVREGSGRWFDLFSEAIAGEEYTFAADPFAEPAAVAVA